MPPASSRSSSISAASANSKFSDVKKKFSCNFPACGKSFSRSEHLHRHALNHKEGTNTCLRCSAHFRRRDLLDRHMARHKEKDDEAGGEGLGILATRKRLWRDANGNIVNARRPSYTPEGPKRRTVNRVEKRAQKPTAIERERKISRGQAMMVASLPSPSTTIPMSRHGSNASSTIVVDSGKYEYPDPEAPEKYEEESWLNINNTLLSPPNSEPSQPGSPGDELSDLDGLYEDASWPLNHGIPPPSDSSRGSITPPEFTAAGCWSQPPVQPQPFQTFMGAMAEIPSYDDLFKPEPSMYEWQHHHWNSNSQVLMSRCREEKFEPNEERKIEWGATTYVGQQDTGYRRTTTGFGLGTC